jgi:predicted transcriptional regulator
MPELDEQLVTLTADIVSAHVANNSVAVGDLATLIGNVHSALAGLGQKAAESAPARREPVVSIRSSIKPDAITCLMCKSPQKMLKRHLATAHGMTPQEYRAEFDLKPDYPMVAPNYAETRRALALKIGLGTKGRGRGKAAAPAKAGKRRGPAKGSSGQS